VIEFAIGAHPEQVARFGEAHYRFGHGHLPYQGRYSMPAAGWHALIPINVPCSEMPRRNRSSVATSARVIVHRSFNLLVTVNVALDPGVSGGWLE
jgi:hypothetical protein